MCLTLLRSEGRSQKQRGSLRLLPPLEIRPSSIAKTPAESREAPPISTVSLTSHRHSEKLLEATGKSRGSTRLEALVPSHDSRARTRSPSPRAWRPDFPGPIFPSGCEGKLGVALESLQGWQETLISLDFCRWPQGASQNAYEKSGILWRLEGPLGTPLALSQWKRALSRGDELQNARLPCPSPPLGACSNSCALSR